MALLSIPQLQKLVSIPGGMADADCALLYLPTGYAGPVTAGRVNLIKQRSCWNWALCAGEEGNPASDSSPESLYANTGYESARGERFETFQPNFISEPDLPQWWQTAMEEAYGDSEADDALRINFMRGMARVAARANQLQPTPLPTPYKLHVTTVRHQWYGWKHWGLSFTYNGRVRYVQTDTGNDLEWGSDFLWEWNHEGHISTWIYLREIHQAHLEVIECFLEMAQCTRCARVKPANTAASRWHRCTGALHHCYCGACLNHLPWNLGDGGVRAYTCNANGCNSGTAAIVDP